MIDFNNLDWLFKAAQQNAPASVSDKMGLLNNPGMGGLLGSAGLLGGAPQQPNQGAQLNANALSQIQQTGGLLSQPRQPVLRQQQFAANPVVDYNFLSRLTGGV